MVHTQKRVRRMRPKIYFDSPSEAIARLKKFKAVEQNGVIYIEERVGLKVLGAVDYLKKARKASHSVPVVVFGKHPTRN